MEYLGDFVLDDVVQVYFTTHDKNGAAIAPSTALEAADVIIYKDGSASQKLTTNGLVMTSPFDTVVGLHHLSIDTGNDTGDGGWWVTGADYTIVLSPDETVDGETVVRVIAVFSTENRSALRSTVAGRTVDIAATGEAGIDLGNTLGNLVAADFGAGSLDGKGDWNIGKSGYALTVANWNVGKTGYALTTQDWNVGKTGYSLTQAFPANFASLSISAGGLVDLLQTAADKVWATATRQLSSLQANLITAVSIAASALNGKGDWNIGKSGYSISGTITTLDGLNNFDPTSDNVAIVTTLSNLPTIPANWLTVTGIADNAFAAAKFAAASLNGKGDWNTVVPLTAAQTESEVNDALVVLHLDHLLAVDYNPAAKPGVATALLNELVESDGGISRFTANALEQVMASTLSELTSIPAATPTVGQALMLPFMGIRNKRDTTATLDEIHNSAGTPICDAVLSDDTVVFTKAKYT